MFKFKRFLRHMNMSCGLTGIHTLSAVQFVFVTV